ncbi:Uncharacterised protein [Actinobacillus equuli]|nr:Uncharacterised protein [Actinobacillus equuli]
MTMDLIISHQALNPRYDLRQYLWLTHHEQFGALLQANALCKSRIDIRLIPEF